MSASVLFSLYRYGVVLSSIFSTFATPVPSYASTGGLSGHTDTCARACASIAQAMPDQVYYSTTNPVFKLFDGKQNEYQPACRFTPKTSQDVAEAIGILGKAQCSFAVKSGGRSRIPNSSNSDGGVTIDLLSINEVTIDEDAGTATIGSGGIWGDVFEQLEAKDLMVNGGRVATIGVGGFLMGGGLGFYSPKRGFASDDVVQYELVLPNSTIANITQDNHPELFSSLRGGGNNFGVVTHFTMNTFKQGPHLEGAKTFTDDKMDAVFTAFDKLWDNEDLDVAAYLYCLYDQAHDMNLCGLTQHHSSDNLHPPSLAEIDKIEALSSTMRIGSDSNAIREQALGVSAGLRNVYSTLTFEPSPELNKEILVIHHEEIESVKTVTGVLPVVVIQPLYKRIVERSRENGGAAYNFTTTEGPLTIFSTAITWSDPADDAVMFDFNNRIMTRVKAAAESKGLLNPYVYQNYAYADQDVFAGYGTEALKKMRKVQHEIDPKGMFTKTGLCSGYFKVNDGPDRY